jgi:hypothetical protein
MSSLELAKPSVVEQEPEPQEAKIFGRSWNEVLAPGPGQNKNGYSNIIHKNEQDPSDNLNRFSFQKIIKP